MTDIEFHSLSLSVESAKTDGGRAFALNTLAWELYAASRFTEAIKYAEQALLFARKAESDVEKAKAFNTLGILHDERGEYHIALDNYQQSLALFEKMGEKKGIATTTNNVGSIYYGLGEYPKALEYYEKALAMNQELHDETGIAFNTGNLGLVYLNLEDYSTSLEYHTNALAMNKAIGDAIGVAIETCNIGTAYTKLREYATALEYYEQSLELCAGLTDLAIAAATTNSIGVLYANTDFEGYNPEKAEKYLLDGLVMLENIGIKKSLYELHKELADFYKKRSDREKYSFHIETYHALEREVQNEEAVKLARQFDFERTLSEKEMQRMRALFEAEQSKSQAEIYRLRNEELAEALEQVHRLNASLSTAIAEKNEIIGIVAHDLKNPVGTILMLAKILHHDDLSQEEIKEFSADMIHSGNQMFELITNILHEKSVEGNQVLLNYEAINASEILQHAVLQFQRHAAAKNISVIHDIQSDMYAHADTIAFISIAENLISNAIKYSSQGTNIYVNAKKLG